MEAPFSDKEKRIVLTEAIKTSSVSVDKLLTFINESNVQPIWSEVLLPYGRNLNSCMNVWNTLRGASSSSVSSLPAPPPERKRKSAPEALEPSQAAPQPKRRQSGADNMIRIQPKPSSNGSPLSFSTPPTTQQPKKRGRPSKADVEARNAAAIARGEVIAPPRTPASRETIGGEAATESGIASGGFGGMVTIAPMIPPGPASEPSRSTGTPFQSGPNEGETGGRDVSGKKKRGRPGSRSSKEPKKGEGSFSAQRQSFGQFELTQPPATKPAETPSEPPALPPKPEAKAEEGESATPVLPPPQELVSPEPERSERSERSQRSDI